MAFFILAAGQLFGLEAINVSYTLFTGQLFNAALQNPTTLNAKFLSANSIIAKSNGNPCSSTNLNKKSPAITGLIWPVSASLPYLISGGCGFIKLALSQQLFVIFWKTSNNNSLDFRPSVLKQISLHFVFAFLQHVFRNLLH